MPLIGNQAKITPYLRYAHELAFSIYFPGLLIWVNDASSGWVNAKGDKGPWVLQLESLITEGHRPHSPVDDPLLRFAFVLLWVISALGVFLLLRVLSRFSLVQVFLRTCGGIIAVAGFALAYLYVNISVRYTSTLGRVAGLSWAMGEVAVALLCTFLYLLGRWPWRAPWTIVLLFLHFTLWSFLAWGMRYSPLAGVPLLWPGFRLSTLTTEAPQLIYPWLGFLTSLAWGLYVRATAWESRVATTRLGTP